MTIEAAEVLAFWFEEIAPSQWWTRSEALDRRIAERFGALHEAASRCELHAWRASPGGRLAEVLVLDQFSRNLHRDSPRAFACDGIALALAQTAVQAGDDQRLPVERRAFFYLPYMHSESLAIHRELDPLLRQPGLEGNLRSGLQHRAILERFGRYPHRNAILGRASTPEELEFLKQPGSSF
jgi:uncharacterized protein (DUF924 family)